MVLECKYEGEQRANYNWGSLFHGFLMQALPGAVADMLHESALRPFSQYVLVRADNQITWQIGLWDEEIAGDIVQVIMPLSRLELAQKGLTLSVAGVQRITRTENEFFDYFFIRDNPCRRYEIEFLTPCTHKQAGRYVLFPSPELMVNSLIRRYSAFSRDISLDEPAVMLEISRHIHIVRYSLRSAVYYLENTKITGYTGRITVVIGGPEQLARLAGALLSFGEYSGIGIKTALGMGGARVKAIV